MSSHANIVNATSGQLIPATKFGQITDIHVVASAAGAGYVALYNGDSTAGDLLYFAKVAQALSNNETNLKIQFHDAGVYALVGANTEALIVWGEWAGAKATPILSGG